VPKLHNSIVIDDLTIQHNPVSMVSADIKEMSCLSFKSTQLNRNAIKRIKKDLVCKDPKYESLKKKFLGSDKVDQVHTDNQTSSLPRDQNE